MCRMRAQTESFFTVFIFAKTVKEHTEQVLPSWRAAWLKKWKNTEII